MKVSFLVQCYRSSHTPMALWPITIPDTEPPPVLTEPSHVITEQEDDPFIDQSLATQSAAPFTSIFTTLA